MFLWCRATITVVHLGLTPPITVTPKNMESRLAVKQEQAIMSRLEVLQLKPLAHRATTLKRLAALPVPHALLATNVQAMPWPILKLVLQDATRKEDWFGARNAPLVHSTIYRVLLVVAIVQQAGSTTNLEIQTAKGEHNFSCFDVFQSLIVELDAPINTPIPTLAQEIAMTALRHLVAGLYLRLPSRIVVGLVPHQVLLRYYECVNIDSDLETDLVAVVLDIRSTVKEAQMVEETAVQSPTWDL
ncbi:hypothetical protein NLJ89_g2261 [Agrocybe chaxingu]|uniref:Uncharacterized protein n=1 Tax=Agrocybe chaxingu TaxID=84603 RepID=A0A9W8K748_9AGAR|nr:hypothetical protein NLJ89_g2261 [Agrocybe chaxingu]